MVLYKGAIHGVRDGLLADECGKGTSAGFAEPGALVPPTSVGGAPLIVYGFF
jgi:hypothetical protein